MLCGYKWMCRLLWVLGLRSTLRPSPHNTKSVYHADSLHFTNWAFLYEGTQHVPENNPVTLLNKLYSCFSLLLVTIHPVLQLHHIIRAPSNEYDAYRYCNFLFSLIVPLQFVCTYSYLQTDHVEPHLLHIVHENKDESKYPFMTSSTSSSASRDGTDKHNEIKTIVPMFRRALTGTRQCQMHRLRCIRSIVWLSVGVFSVTVLVTGVLDEYRHTETRVLPICFTILSMIGMAMGVVVQSVSVILFSVVFSNHYVDLLHTCECLSVCYDNTGCRSSVIMNYLLRHIALLKYSVGTSIRHLHGVFSSFSVPWAAGFALLLHTLISNRNEGAPGIRTDTACYATCYGLVQMLYFVLIHYIHCGKQMIVDAIHVPNFILTNLGRSINPARDLLDMMDRTGSYDTGIEEICSMTDRCRLQLLMENASTIDWIVVNNTLQQEWTHFQFCGLSLNDSSMIKRCAALVGVIIGGRYLFSV